LFVSSLLQSGNPSEFSHAHLLLEMAGDTEGELVALALAPVLAPQHRGTRYGWHDAQQLAPQHAHASLVQTPAVAAVVIQCCLHCMTRIFLHDPASSARRHMRQVWKIVDRMAPLAAAAAGPGVRVGWVGGASFSVPLLARAVACASHGFEPGFSPIEHLTAMIRSLDDLPGEGKRAAEAMQMSMLQALAPAGGRAVSVAAAQSDTMGLYRLAEALRTVMGAPGGIFDRILPTREYSSWCAARLPRQSHAANAEVTV